MEHLPIINKRWLTPEGQKLKQEIVKLLAVSQDWRFLLRRHLPEANDVKRCLDLRGIDLSGKDLSGAKLQEVDLSGANLSNCILNNVNLNNAKVYDAFLQGVKGNNLIAINTQFVRSNMDNSRFANCYFGGSSFEKALLRNTNFNACKVIYNHCDRATFSKTIFKDSSIQFLGHQADLSYSTLENCDLSKSILIDSNLRQSKFINVKAEKVNFKGRSFQGGEFTDVKFEKIYPKGIDLQFTQSNHAENELVARWDTPKCKKIKTRLLSVLDKPDQWEKILQKLPKVDKASNGLDFRGLHLKEANLKGVKFNQVDLSFTTFEKCNLARTVFTNASLKNVNFLSCQGEEAAFKNIQINNTYFENTDFSKSIFQNLNLAEVIFLKSNFNEALIENLNGKDYSFIDCNFFQSFLSSINGLNVVFDGSSFYGAKLEKLQQLPKSSFIHCDFQKSFIDFSGANLEYSLFDLSYFSYTNQYLDFKKSNLQNVSFQHATLQGPDFRQAQIEGISFEKTTLFKGYFDNPSPNNIFQRRENAVFPFHIAELKKRWLTKTGQYLKTVILSHAKQKKLEYLADNWEDFTANFPFASETEGLLDLRGIDLSGLNLSSHELDYSDLSWANLNDSVFDNANLSGCKFVGASLQRVRATNVNWYLAWGVESDFSSSYFINCDFTQASFTNCIFQKTLLEKCKMNFFRGDYSDFSQSKFKNVQFIGEYIGRNICFDQVDFVNEDLSEAILINASFREANLKGSNFQRTKLLNAFFDNADLQGANLQEANLSGASFHNADTNGTNFIRAKF